MHGDDHVHAWTRSEISGWQSRRCERKRKDEAYKEKELGDSSNKLDYIRVAAAAAAAALIIQTSTYPFLIVKSTTSTSTL
ncbi:hypothetical protein BHE74_00049625 [Ensete ventricosum]|nr:hypothetical protein BHE74_00049625 [Ensete ventricosum]